MPAITIKREMTISRNEFFRLIPTALAGFDYQVKNDAIVFPYESGITTIAIVNETERKIASLALPVLHVQFEFDGIVESLSEELLKHFFKIYQRGGG